MAALVLAALRILNRPTSGLGCSWRPTVVKGASPPFARSLKAKVKGQKKRTGAVYKACGLVIASAAPNGWTKLAFSLSYTSLGLLCVCVVSTAWCSFVCVVSTECVLRWKS